MLFSRLFEVGKYARLAISKKVTVIFLLHVNTCSSAPGERPFTTVLHVKTWLFLVVTQKRFNRTPILNSHKVKTENLGLLTLVNIFVCNDKCHQNFGRLAVMI